MESLTRQPCAHAITMQEAGVRLGEKINGCSNHPEPAFASSVDSVWLPL